METKEILKELDAIFKMVSSIPVTNDFIDVSAAARNKLRKVYTMVKMNDKEEPKNETIGIQS